MLSKQCTSSQSRAGRRRAAHARRALAVPVAPYPGPRPTARLPEVSVAPSQGPLPEAAPCPRRLGVCAVACRALRSMRRVLARLQPAVGRYACTCPGPWPWWLCGVGDVAYKRGGQPLTCAGRSPAGPSRSACRLGTAALSPPLAPFPVVEPLPNLLTRPPRCCPHCPSACTGRALAGAEGAAAGTDRRSRTIPPAAPPPRTSVGIEPKDPGEPPPPAPGRPRPPVCRNSAGPPPASARGPNCEVSILSECLSANQGHIGKIPNLSKDLVQK
jgi:hypothetical protein